MRIVASLLLGLTLCFSVAVGNAEPPDWQPDPPLPDEFDWIQLTSDEWLKGELIAMYDEELEFDSAELDLLKLDWDDIRQIRSARIVRILFLGKITATGRLIVDGEVVRIIGERDETFDRSRVLTITAGEPRELNYWSGNITLGANVRSGNTEQTEISVRSKFLRRTIKNRISLELLGSYDVTNDVKTTENVRMSVNWDKFMTDRFFLTPVSLEYFRDPFQNIGNRVTLHSGAGYALADTKKVDWEVFGGPALQKTWFESAVPGESRNEFTPAFLIGTSLEIDISSHIEFNFTYDAQFVNTESGSYNHHTIAGFATEVTSLLDFDVSFVWDRIQNPTPGADLIVPEKNDFTLIVGLGLDF